MIVFRTRQSLFLCCLVVALYASRISPLGAENIDYRPRTISLGECIEEALLNNRILQIERINQEVARLALNASYGYYDPLFVSTAQREHTTDTGGFDPADFSRDAIYDAHSEVAGANLTGFLPGGSSYSFSGSYAHSDGTRNSLNFDSYKLFTGVSIRQPLLKNFWTDQGRTEIRISRKNLKITELGVAYLVTDAINQVRQAYHELQFTLENLEVRRRLLASKEATLSGVQRQVEVGTLTVLEERLAESQVARVQAELVAASNAVRLAENVLKTLQGYTTTNWTEGPLTPVDRLLVIPEPVDLSESWQRGLEQRPDLAQMEQDLERADIDLRYRYNQLFPSLDLLAIYARRGASFTQSVPPASTNASFSAAFDQIADGDSPNKVVGLSFSIPLSRARERASYRAGKELKEQAYIRLRQKQELILREISDAFHNVQSARERALATENARRLAQAALEAEEQKLAGGTSSLFFVFQLQGDLADVESAEVRARADYNKALSQLYFAEGTLVKRSQMVIKVGNASLPGCSSAADPRFQPVQLPLR